MEKSSPPEPGCLILGVAGSVDTLKKIELQNKHRPIYVTRHRIDSFKQSKPLCREVAHEMFLPCMECDEDDAPVSCGWQICRSEMTLFTLHMSTLVFGVVKEALDMRHVEEIEEDLHLAHTVIETIITLVIIILRMINTRMGCVEVQLTVQRLQYFDQVYEPNLRAVWTWMWLLLATGAINFVLCIVCFVVFDQTTHLGWTILSNQGCILTMRVLSGFYESRISMAVNKIKQDQYKVVIHEALVLLQESSAVQSTDNVDSKNFSTPDTCAVQRFVSAAFNTEALAKPSYIVLRRDRQPKYHCPKETVV